VWLAAGALHAASVGAHFIVIIVRGMAPARAEIWPMKITVAQPLQNANFVSCIRTVLILCPTTEHKKE
jgi:hypothetical protein